MIAVLPSLYCVIHVGYDLRSLSESRRVVVQRWTLTVLVDWIAIPVDAPWLFHIEVHHYLGLPARSRDEWLPPYERRQANEPELQLGRHHGRN